MQRSGQHPTFGVWPLAVFAVVACGGRVAGADAPDFQRDVRPILAESCFRCHGFDAHARQAGLRLDTRAGATTPADSGRPAIVPGHPQASELLRRITSRHDDERMPPAEIGKALTAAQVAVLQRWIAAGAEYQPHWAFTRPQSRPLPDVVDRHWSRNLIDRFVLARLEREGLRPSAETDAARLLRRVSLDLIGLPPTPQELDHFLSARAQNPDAAYEAEVDRLLASPHFGERMAIDWLDAARYADTNGYFGDKPRQIWPWRDWVIAAFNANQPFDRFTIEQLAGDLLPEPTRDQRVATGFHRNSMANNESGIIDEEFRVEAIADRVETTAAVWMGLTVGCAQCHDHKYDPVSQRDYYRLFAYFNRSVETGLVTKDNPPPKLDVPTPEQQQHLQQLGEQRRAAEAEFQSQAEMLEAALAVWESTALATLPPLPTGAALSVDFESEPAGWQVVGTNLVHQRGIRGQAGKFDATQHLETRADFDPDAPWTMSLWVQPAGSLGCLWSKIEPQGRRRGVELIWQKGRLQLHLVHRWGENELTVTTEPVVSSGKWHQVIVSYAGAGAKPAVTITIDGQPAEYDIVRNTLTGTLRCEEPLRIGRRDAGLGYYGQLDEFQLLPRVVDTAAAADWAAAERLRGIVTRDAGDRTADDRERLREHYIRHHADPALRQAYDRWQQAERAEQAARAAIPSTLVMRDRPEARPTHILQRGQYDQLGDAVSPGVPEFLGTPRTDLPDNRLGLAEWLVSPEHPLTARVAVNRLWQQCFGEGLVRTPNDFGLQGESPTHPELLDALALRFLDSGWDVKALLRLIVTSATYRQSSASTPALRERDPENRLLARGPRFRLPAELVRDQALASSGLLTRTLGGPSVRPWQPPGLWEEVSYNAEESYVPDTGAAQWRRSLYTYWKRQAPPPALLIFDANTREKCLIKRSRTNTPLQALVTLNDPTYMAAARALVEQLQLQQRHIPDRDMARELFRRVVSRWPEPEETMALVELVTQQRSALATDSAAVRRVLDLNETTTVGVSPDVVTRAAWVLVGHTILNLDEVFTRR